MVFADFAEDLDDAMPPPPASAFAEDLDDAPPPPCEPCNADVIVDGVEEGSDPHDGATSTAYGAAGPGSVSGGDGDEVVVNCVVTITIGKSIINNL